MTRISLKEAYDNRDVIAQIARLNDIVEDLPNPDLTNVVLKTGNQIIDGVKQFNDQVILAGGMDLSALGPTIITGDLDISGDLQVDGDIIQTGAAYETHAEQVFSKNDYIVMRDEAVSSLPAGSYSGLQVKKYDGVSDCRLVVDNQGIARVGDINDEKPLLVRDEVADLVSGDLLRWDGVNQKAITYSVDSAITSGSAHPIQSGAVYDAVKKVTSGTGTLNANASVHDGHNPTYRVRGGIAFVYFDVTMADTAATQGQYKDIIIGTGFPHNVAWGGTPYVPLTSAGSISVDGEVGNPGWCYVDGSGNLRIFARNVAVNGKTILGSCSYFTE